MIGLLITLLIAVVVLAIFYTVLGLIPGLPPWARQLIMLVGVLIVLLWMVGSGSFSHARL